MNTLYVVAIGGSGERILRSLIMALTAGVDMPVREVVPVIVDNDTESAALNCCTNLIKNYQDGSIPGVSYMCKDMAQKPSFCHVPVSAPILLNVSGGGIGTLKDIIGCPTPSGEQDEHAQAISSLAIERDLLFTDDELKMALNVGFVGCPNIGSVVLNSKALSSPQFNAVKAASAEDGVVILGSLFGGTGAAGIPLIVNKLLQECHTNARIGVVAMLPYFDIEDEVVNDTPILDERYDVRSDIFDLKTRAALMYYHSNMSKEVDYFYYVGDDTRHTFHKSLGGKNQDNPATLCDLMAAMAIVDFSKGASTNSTTYKLPVWGFCDDSCSTANNSGIFNEDLQKSLVKFTLMEQVFRHKELLPFVVKNEKKAFDFVQNIGFREDILDSIVTDSKQIPFTKATGLNALIHAFDEWVAELAHGNKRTTHLGRILQIFNNQADVEADKLAMTFYSDSQNNMGLAKYEHVKKLFREEYDQPLSADMLDALQKAYRALPEQYRKNVPENMIIPITLLYISNALDEVLAKCYSIYANH